MWRCSFHCSSAVQFLRSPVLTKYMTTSSSLKASARQRAACLYSLLWRTRIWWLAAEAVAALELELEASDMLGRDSIVTAGLDFFSMASGFKRGFLYWL